MSIKQSLEKLSKLVKVSKNRDYRTSKGLCIVSGKKLLNEMSQKDLFRDVVASRKSFASNIKSQNDPLILDRRMTAKLSNMNRFSGGYVATTKIPDPFVFFDVSWRLILDINGVKDHGMLGTILRSCVAFDFDAVCITGRHADLFDSKTIRASTGALWNISYSTVSKYSEIQEFGAKHKLLTITLPDQCDMSFRDFKASENKFNGVILRVLGGIGDMPGILPLSVLSSFFMMNFREIFKGLKN